MVEEFGRVRVVKGLQAGKSDRCGFVCDQEGVE